MAVRTRFRIRTQNHSPRDQEINEADERGWALQQVVVQFTGQYLLVFKRRWPHAMVEPFARDVKEPEVES